MSDARKKADEAAKEADGVRRRVVNMEQGGADLDAAVALAAIYEARASRLAAEARHQERMEADDARHRELNPAKPRSCSDRDCNCEGDEVCPDPDVVLVELSRTDLHALGPNGELYTPKQRGIAERKIVAALDRTKKGTR